MKDTILLLVGFASGVLVAAAFGAKVKEFVANTLLKAAAKVEGDKGK